MAEEIAFENKIISNFEGLMTLTLDRVVLHTVVHHSLTPTYITNFIEIEETICGRMDIPQDGWTDGHLRPALWCRLRRVDLITIMKVAAYFNLNRCFPGGPGLGSVHVTPVNMAGLVVRASDLRLHGYEFNLQPPNYRSVDTGMDDRLQANIPSQYVTSHPNN